jgi:hypothetical protein
MEYMDLEEDEERDFFRWENIEGSEDYIILEERGCKYEEDDYETGEYSKIIKSLQEISPSIRWRVTFNGTDRYGARPSQWRVICVPEDQFTEAQYIFDRFLNGDDLSNYCYTDKYPEIYDKLPNKQSKLKENIISLHLLLSEFEETLFDKNRHNSSTLFNDLVSVLPQIYFYANSLPYISDAHDLGYQGSMSFDRNLILDQYDEFFYVPDPYNKSIEASLLSGLLLSIYEEIEQGLIAFSTNNPDLISAAVNDWRVGFSIEHGWGRDILIALSAIHQAKRKIRNK